MRREKAELEQNGEWLEEAEGKAERVGNLGGNTERVRGGSRKAIAEAAL